MPLADQERYRAIVELEQCVPISHRASQFSFARTRCRHCNYSALSRGYTKDGVLYMCFTHHISGDRNTTHIYSPKRHLLRWVFKLTYYAIRLRRILSAPRRNMALLALRKVPEAGLREKIIRLAGLW